MEKIIEIIKNERIEEIEEYLNEDFDINKKDEVKNFSFFFSSFLSSFL